MISKTKLAIGLLLVAATQPYAYADTSENGLFFNGIGLNGWQINGLQLNGIQLNGLQLNGLQLNGWEMNGLGLNGWSLNGLEVQKEESVLNPLVSLAAEPLTK